MATGVWAWSTTAASNDSADTTINWAEGQAASTVNNSARAGMAGQAKYLLDAHGALTTTGAADTYSVSTNSTLAALRDGVGLSLVLNATSTGASTLNVDGLGAKAIRKITGAGEVAVAAGDVVAAGHYIFNYDASANSASGAWILLNPAPSATAYLSNVVEDTSPQLGAMLDVNTFGIGDGTLKILDFVEDASAVNYVEIEHEATGAGPILRAVGTDTNVDFNLVSKGTGEVKANAQRIGLAQTLAKTAHYTVLVADRDALIDCDASSGAVTITLPTVATALAGFTVTVKKSDSGTNAITVDGNGAETIDGAATTTVVSQYDSLTIQCDGAEWFVTSIKTASTAVNSGQVTIAKTTTYTVLVGDFAALITGDASGGAFSITLPTVADAGDGFEITIKKIDSGSNAVTVDGAGSETIDGATTYDLAAQWDSAIFRCDGTGWNIRGIKGGSGGGGGWVVIETYDFAVDGAASDIVFETGLENYSDLELLYTDVSSTAHSIMSILIGTGAGPTYAAPADVASNGYSGWQMSGSTITASSLLNTTSSTVHNVAATRGLDGFFRLNCANTDQRSLCEMFHAYQNTSSAQQTACVKSGQATGAIITGLKFSLTTGDTDGGTVILRGRP